MSQVSEIANSSACPLLVADGIHVFSQKVYGAICRQDRETLTSVARAQIKAGAQALAVNLGPGRKMRQHVPWVIDTLRTATDIPLFYSANILAHHDILQVHGKSITINAVTANDDELQRALQSAETYGCSVVVLLVKSGKGAATLDDRISLACEVLEKATVLDLPLSRLYLDPVLAYRPDPVAWKMSRGMPDVADAAEAISLIKQLDGQVRTIAALGNCTGTVNRSRVLAVLTAAGLDAVMLDCLDPSVMNTAVKINDCSYLSGQNGNVPCFSSAA